MVFSLLILGLVGCSKPDAVVSEPLPAVQSADSSDLKRVLVVINKSSEVSRTVGSYYVNKRGIPKDHVVLIDCPTTDNILPNIYDSQIEPTIKVKLKALGGIDFIVLTKGIPLRLQNGAGYSVDSLLVSMNTPNDPEMLGDPEHKAKPLDNPYYKQTAAFDAKKFKMYLVTRLDGYTIEDCKALVDRSLAAKPEKGPFFFDAMAGASGGYLEMNETLKAAGKVMTDKGYEATTDTQAAYVKPEGPLMGYATWGSNDGKFDAAIYKSLQFKPGALCETFVSTSARTFNPVTSGQSMIADLIAQGVTGVKGYVSEPYTIALAHPDILFDRYTSGMNLAESFYAASPLIKWKDLVIGDPLCRPYKK